MQIHEPRETVFSFYFVQSVKVIEGSGILWSFSNTPFTTKLPYILEVKHLNMA